MKLIDSFPYIIITISITTLSWFIAAWLIFSEPWELITASVVGFFIGCYASAVTLWRKYRRTTSNSGDAATTVPKSNDWTEPRW